MGGRKQRVAVIKNKKDSNLCKWAPKLKNPSIILKNDKLTS